jgi:voltage-gated potassium channel
MEESNAATGYQGLAGPASEPGNTQLDRYLDKTQNVLDIVALLTLWIVVVPPSDFGEATDVQRIALVIRIGLSALYGIDMTIRTVLARHHTRYLRHNVIGIVAVLFPPVRVLFSLRLIRSLFRRGNLDRFLVAAIVLLLNGALMVFFFERNAPGSNIHTAGESIWWAIVTVTTVGYGDYFPVTVAGKVVATFIMAIGIITVAVITAQVASAFVDQAARRRSADALADPADRADLVEPDDSIEPEAAVTLADLDQRLARIEALVSALAAAPGAGPGPAA